jgi:signal peptidase II
MLRWTWVSAFIIFTDQFTKWMAEANLEEGLANAYQVFPHLNFSLAYNYGAAFSFLGNQGGWQRWFFTILAFAVSLFILNWMRKLPETQRWTGIGLALILGGAIGNLIDRVLYGKVIDFIDVYFSAPWNPNYHFATFNVADMGITVGAALLIFISLFSSSEE